jgi:hemerythrin-like domain-containing protein
MTREIHLHTATEQPEQAFDAAATSRDISEYLGADHARLDAIVPEILDAIDSVAFEAAQARFAEFSRGLETHIQVEDDQLFPAFEHATGITGRGPSFVMRGEHVEIRRLLKDIARALDECDVSRARETVQWLVATLRLHNTREERVLYPMADRALGDAWKQAFLKRCQGL